MAGQDPPLLDPVQRRLQAGDGGCPGRAGADRGIVTLGIGQRLQRHQQAGCGVLLVDGQAARQIGHELGAVEDGGVGGLLFALLCVDRLLSKLPGEQGEEAEHHHRRQRPDHRPALQPRALSGLGLARRLLLGGFRDRSLGLGQRPLARGLSGGHVGELFAKDGGAFVLSVA